MIKRYIKLASSGRRWWLDILSVTIAMGFVVGVNWLLLRSVRSEINESRIEFVPLQSGMSLPDIFVLEFGWADSALLDSGTGVGDQSWLERVCLRRGDPSISRIKKVLEVLVNESGVGAETDTAVLEAFNPCTIYAYIMVGVDYLSVDDVLNRLARDEKLAQVLRVSPSTAAKIEFLRKLTENLNDEVRSQTRWIKLFNGFFQLLIYSAFFIVIGRLVYRLLMAKRNILQFNREFLLGATDLKLPNDATKLKALATKARPTMTNFYRRTVETQYYEPTRTIMGMLPSFGFLGTVYGMGAALVHSSGLQNDQLRSEAIASMSSKLGLAFDTTFVALVCLILAEALLLIVRAREERHIELYVGQISPLTGG